MVHQNETQACGFYLDGCVSLRSHPGKSHANGKNSSSTVVHGDAPINVRDGLDGQELSRRLARFGTDRGMRPPIAAECNGEASVGYATCYLRVLRNFSQRTQCSECVAFSIARCIPASKRYDEQRGKGSLFRQCS